MVQFTTSSNILELDTCPPDPEQCCLCPLFWYKYPVIMGQGPSLGRTGQAEAKRYIWKDKLVREAAKHIQRWDGGGGLDPP